MTAAPGPDARTAAVEAFLARAGWADAARRPLAGDASFRRYLRLSRADGSSAILMDAPPPMEDVRPFVRIAGLLGELGLTAPRILAHAPRSGLVLEEDLGDDTFAALLDRGTDPEALFAAAVDVLVHLRQRVTAADLATLPTFGVPRLAEESALVTDWFLPAWTGRPTPPELRADYVARWTGVLTRAPFGPPTLVLRDYFASNLIWLPQRDGVRRCGLLDFQDAVAGPAAYDLVSLLEDVRRDVPDELGARMYERYLDRAGIADRDGFRHAYAVLGAQRNLRIAGVFTRLHRRDGKAHYLAFMDRVWALVARDLGHPALAPIAEWLDRHVPVAWRTRPPVRGVA
ncbi:aminoglycoside phosphotransferase family protein [Stella sp.]|uniref:aminoglycoside phosphotransferase family protein n=1 Tax=Stella sp. TaxID=2912054 RepID=UPI0035B29685